MVEQGGHERLVLTHDRGMNRGEPGLGGVRVRASLEQQRDQVAEPGVGRECGGADAPGIRIVDVRAGGNQMPRRRHIAHAGGEQQRRVSTMRYLAVVLRLAVRRHRHHLTPYL